MPGKRTWPAHTWTRSQLTDYRLFYSATFSRLCPIDATQNPEFSDFLATRYRRTEPRQGARSRSRPIAIRRLRRNTLRGNGFRQLDRLVLGRRFVHVFEARHRPLRLELVQPSLDGQIASPEIPAEQDQGDADADDHAEHDDDHARGNRRRGGLDRRRLMYRERGPDQ